MNLDQERQAIRDELESLRASGARRQELSLHACKRLFSIWGSGRPWLRFVT